MKTPAILFLLSLVVFGAAGLFASTLADPLSLILIGANLAALNFAFLAFHTLWVNRTLLPRELRPPLWRQAALLVCGCFFAGLAWAGRLCQNTAPSRPARRAVAR